MTAAPLVLPRNPPLGPAQDFYHLRREGISFIAKAGSTSWTDYNVHDPGITLLEALCYAITDLAYRIDWDIDVILAPETPTGNPQKPYPDQAFFTARDILTVSPTTTDDFRRLLIDVTGAETQPSGLSSVPRAGVSTPLFRNAWLICKDCACETSWYARCSDDQLELSFDEPADIAPAPKQVWARGLYDVLLELNDDPELGDLNGRLVTYAAVVHDEANAHPYTMELRFPDIALLDRDAWKLFLTSDVFADPGAFEVKVTRLGATKDFDIFAELPSDTARDDYIRRHWRDLFNLSFEIDIPSSGKSIVLANASLRVLGDAAVRNGAKAADWRALFQSKDAGGFIRRWIKKARAAHRAVEHAKATLQAHRNLDEDYCSIALVGIEEVAVCADVEVQPGADIERVQAEIWFRIEQYLSPPLQFRTLQELRESGMSVEDIFNGPALENGFITQADLSDAALKPVLRASDIINRLMQIDGVVAVNQLRLSKYDAEGALVAGAADPIWSGDTPIFDPSRTSAVWLLFIASGHQPRLYLSQSNFRFYKNGLPFLPRHDEAKDTLNELRGSRYRPIDPSAPKDLAVPVGAFRNPDDYHPVQYSLPAAYGVSPAGLPLTATKARRAQAKNLKAYLLVFEQLLGNAFAQLANTARLFSLDPTVDRTYFVKAISSSLIAKLSDIVKHEIDPAINSQLKALTDLVETPPEFHRRRNLPIPAISISRSDRSRSAVPGERDQGGGRDGSVGLMNSTLSVR